MQLSRPPPPFAADGFHRATGSVSERTEAKEGLDLKRRSEAAIVHEGAKTDATTLKARTRTIVRDGLVNRP